VYVCMRVCVVGTNATPPVALSSAVLRLDLA
jgi:hypothetical protein